MQDEEDNYDDLMNLLHGIVSVFALIALVVLAVSHLNATTEKARFENSCLDAGGVPVSSYSGPHCIDRKVLVAVPYSGGDQ